MKLNFFSPLLCLLLFITPGCNDAGRSEATDVNDTTSTNTSPSARYVEFDTTKGVTAISPDLYKKLSDTLGIRILEGTYKPGDSSVLHAHPDFALYVLEGSTVELTSTSGEKQNIEFTKGMAVVLPGETHSAKNIGRSTLKLVVVEVNRPRS